ncbi:MAG TPA: SpoIIE family protein phosphatase [Firmicutes bacterium]|nr:SpoIIE family protein phosphatase [Candidatus Fermentithermobacillaceae bacterium]
MSSGMFSRVRDFFSRKNAGLTLAFSITCFLLGRTVVVRVLYPFGPAMYAGLKVTRSPGSLVFAVICLLGAATTGETGTLLNQVLVMVFVTLLVDPPFVRRRRFPQVVGYALSAAAAFGVRAVVGNLGGITADAFIIAATEAVSIFFLSALFAQASGMLTSDEPSGFSKQALVAAGVLSIGGLPDLSLFSVNVKVLLASTMTLVGAWLTGPGGGAIAGVTGGLITALTSTRSLRVVDYLAVSGTVAGIGGWFGRAEAVAGHLAAGLAMSFFQPGPEDIRSRLIEQMIASALVMVLPSKIAASIKGILSPKNHILRRETLRDAVGYPAPLSRVFKQMADLFSQVSVSGDSAINWAQEAILTVVDRVCHECPNRLVCWEETFGDTFEALCGLVRGLGITGRVKEDDVAPVLKEKCSKLQEMVMELNHEKEIQSVHLAETRFYNETRECLAAQYAYLGKLLENSKPTPKQGRKPHLKAKVRSGAVPGGDGEEPGDSWAAFDIDSTRTFVGLADGMGKGRLAARQSRDTLDILRSLLESGLDYEASISFLNSSLYLAFRPESYVAIDCVLLDLASERAYFQKLGAAPSFIRRADGNVVVVKGAAPPAGSLKSVPWVNSSERIEDGDTILLVSDGLFRSCPVPERAEQWLVSYLARLKADSPESVVRSLLQRGIRRQGGKPEDDITVVAIKVERVELAEELEESAG